MTATQRFSAVDTARTSLANDGDRWILRDRERFDATAGQGVNASSGVGLFRDCY